MPHNFIVGGGFFTRTLLLPVSLAWEAFGVANGAGDLPAVQQRVAKYRAKQDQATQEANPSITCILLAEPFFFPVSSGSRFQRASNSISSQGRATAPTRPKAERSTTRWPSACDFR